MLKMSHFSSDKCFTSALYKIANMFQLARRFPETCCRFFDPCQEVYGKWIGYLGHERLKISLEEEIQKV